MVRRILWLAIGAIVLVAGLAGFGLGCAHRQIRSLEPPLPAAAAFLAVGAETSAEGPIRIHYVETASQRMPRSSVLDPDLDPAPDAPYEMTHSAIVLSWSDGRHFLVDAGMDSAAARDFGGPMERFGGAEPIEVYESIARALGRGARSVQGIGFTHLHVDHVQGLDDLCAAGVKPVVVQTTAQARHQNYTTSGGQQRLDGATCGEPILVEGLGLASVPGFPGLYVAHVAGHTPGSQVFVARLADSVGGHRIVLAGDIANARDGIVHDIPKPMLYSLLIVPEATAQLARIRQRLREVDASAEATVIVAHDRGALRASGIPPWP